MYSRRNNICPDKLGKRDAFCLFEDKPNGGNVEVIGPDISEMEEGSSYPIGLLIDVAGEKLEKDMEPVFERRMHLYANYIEGLYHMNQRDDVWMRLNKDSVSKGLNSMEAIGQMLMFLYTSELDVIEKISITFVTDEKKVEELLVKAKVIYAARDERARGLKDEDVEEVYSCALFQSFAPTHICFATPERMIRVDSFQESADPKFDYENILLPKAVIEGVSQDVLGYEVLSLPDEPVVSRDELYQLPKIFE